MSVQQLPSGRWRAQAWDPITRTKVSVTRVLSRAELDALGADEHGTFDSQEDGIAARAAARRKLKKRRGTMTISEWRQIWLYSDAFGGSWEESTRIHREERTREFDEECGHILCKDFTAEVWAAFLRGGRRRGRRTGNRMSQVDFIRPMMNDAMTATAGRLLDENVSAETRVKRSRGNKDKQPLTEEQMWHLLEVADELTPPSFRDLLAFGCFTAMRPGELDGLEWPQVLYDRDRIAVDQQWNGRSHMLSRPKYGEHEVGLVEPARLVLRRAEVYREPGVRWVFPTLTGSHWTKSSRQTHWNKVRAAIGITATFYLCTRHYFGSYAYNILRLDKRIIAAQLGHRDGGDLVETTYGHPDHQRKLDELVAAYGAVKLGPDPAPLSPEAPVSAPAALMRPNLILVAGTHPEPCVDWEPEPEPELIGAA